MSSPKTEAFARLPQRSVLLAELAEFLLRLEEIAKARRADATANLELPLRRLQNELLERSEFASWSTSRRLAHIYSLSMQETAALIDDLRTLDDQDAWMRCAELTKMALQRAVVRVRRLHD